MSMARRGARLVAIEGHHPGSGDLPSLLQDVVILGHSEVSPAMLGCSISEAEPAWRSTAVSAAVAARLDLAQFDAGDGPCLAAARHQRAHRLDVIGADGSFASFSTAAGRLGVRSSLSLLIPGASTPTSLNLYAGRPAAFSTARSQAIAALLARCAVRLLAPQPAAGSKPGLDEALARGSTVLKAQQRLAARHGVSEPAAFRQLAQRSAREQRSIVELAREVLDGHQPEDR